jgi:hypothetical protein
MFSGVRKGGIVSSAGIPPPVKCFLLHPLLNGFPIDPFLLRVVSIFLLVALRVYLGRDHIVGSRVVLFDFFFRAVAVDLGLFLKMQVLEFVFGAEVVRRVGLRVGVDDEAASGFVGFVAFPFEGRRIVIPVH